MSKFILAVAAAATAFVTSAARAEPAVRIDDAAARAIVRSADLDLNSPGGIYALESRIRMAARQVCQAPPSLADLADYSAYRGCVQSAEVLAKPQADRVIAQARGMRVASEQAQRR